MTHDGGLATGLLEIRRSLEKSLVAKAELKAAISADRVR